MKEKLNYFDDRVSIEFVLPIANGLEEFWK
jgi:hypothetical protein